MGSHFENSRGITVDGMHSYRDFSLVPAGAPVIGMPPVTENYLTVPGGHGAIDLTESLTGYPVFEQRECQWSFYIHAPKARRQAIRDQVVQQVHGRRVKIIEDRAPDVYFDGRVQVADPEKQGGSAITLTGVFEPFRRDITDSTEDWLWDPFSLETGVAREYGSIPVECSATVEFISSPMGGSPEIKASAEGMSVTACGVTCDLSTDWVVYGDIVLPGDYSAVPMTFSGTGTVSIRYRGGRI